MRRPFVAALLCLLALLAPAAAALSQGLLEAPCADGCCAGEDCGDPAEGACPDDCPDCACSAARVFVHAPDVARPAPAGDFVVVVAEESARPHDGASHEILHVPLS